MTVQTATQPETETMTGPEAYAEAVVYANQAAHWADQGLDDRNARNAMALAAVSQAFAAIAQAEATARGSARPGHYPGGGWKAITDPDQL